MTIFEFFIKSMSVLSAVALSVVAAGREMMLSSPLMNEQGAKKQLVKSVNCDNSAIAKVENEIIGKRKMSVLQGKTEDLPFLRNCINYNLSENDEYFCLYNKNQVLYYSISADICVYYRYDCEIGTAVYTHKECYESARKAICDVFGDRTKVAVTECKMTDNSNGICSFCFRTDITGDENIVVGVRRDTRNIVLFDARDAESIIYTKKQGGE